MPRVVWRSNIAEIGAAALYVAELAARRSSTVDYLAGRRPVARCSTTGPLRLEEQFYLVWPILLVVARGCWRAGSNRHRPESCRGRRLGRRPALPRGLLVRHAGAERRVLQHPGPGLGVRTRWPGRPGADADLPASGGTDARGDRCRGGAGLIPRPVGRVRFSRAGSPSSRRWEPRSSLRSAAALAAEVAFAGWAPVQWIGDHSYSIYLWHWPPLIALPWIVHGDARQRGARGNPGRHPGPGLDDQGAGGGPLPCRLAAASGTVAELRVGRRRHVPGSRQHVDGRRDRRRPGAARLDVRSHPDHEQRAMRGRPCVGGPGLPAAVRPTWRCQARLRQGRLRPGDPRLPARHHGSGRATVVRVVGTRRPDQDHRRRRELVRRTDRDDPEPVDRRPTHRIVLRPGRAAWG